MNDANSRSQRAVQIVAQAEGIANISRRPRPRVPILRYPEEALYEEMAFIAYHFHWTPDDILNLEHGERHRCI